MVNLEAVPSRPCLAGSAGKSARFFCVERENDIIVCCLIHSFPIQHPTAPSAAPLQAQPANRPTPTANNPPPPPMAPPSSPSSPSRPGEEERLASYKPGSIRHVRLMNFLTYSDVEFNPGPRLNMVVGPNGTGKSTILCAICLGLGGEPPLLGRADDARTFIMHEKERAIICITLAPTVDPATGRFGPVHTVRRVIDRSKGSDRGRGKGASTFYVNDQVVPKRDVIRLVTETYHIAVDNLCTFLPQDRVGSFSGFDSKALLRETEKSMSGSKHLFHQHEELIERERDIRTSSGSVETIADKLRQLEEESKLLEKEKERMQERKEAERQIRLLEQKRAWLRFDEKRKEAQELKEERNVAKKELQTARKSLAPLQRALDDAEEEVKKLKANRSALDRRMNRAKAGHDKAVSKHGNLDDGIEMQLANLNQIETEQRTLVKRAEAQRRKVELIEADLAELPPEADIAGRLEDATAEVRRIKSQLLRARRAASEAAGEVNDLKGEARKFERALDRMKDERSQRMQRIFHQMPRLKHSYEFVDQNRKMFRRPVLGPIVCEIADVENSTAADCLEQHVPNHVLKSYIVECREDYDLLYREVRTKRNIPINIMLVNEIRPISRPCSAGKMEMLKREHGIMCFLDEAVTAPDIVMQALRNGAQIEAVVMGGSKSDPTMNGRDGLMDILMKREDGSTKSACLITVGKNREVNKYTAIASRYGGSKSMRQDGIAKARLLAKGIDPEAIAEVERDLGEVRKRIQEKAPREQEEKKKYDQLTSEGQAIQKNLNEAKALKADFINNAKKLQVARGKLADIEQQITADTDGEKQKIIKSLKKHVEANISTLEKAMTEYDDLMEATHQSCGVKMNDAGVEAKKRRLEEALQEKQAESHALEDRLVKVKEAFANAKKMLAQYKDEAEAFGSLSEEIRTMLEGLPASLDEIEALLTDAQDKINGIDDNPEVLRRYEERKKEVKETRAELENLNEAKDVKRQQLESLAAPWKKALEKTLEKVNTLFMRYMADLGCAGEVRLRKGAQEEHPDSLGDFENWGVEIRVKFRETSNLQVLSAHHHSGGERSVSTIMYLMSMQDLMVSPFRCVDEINQGLDERNERLVFKRIVENSTQPPKEGHGAHDHIGQYFLITPKLLPNLTDMENEDVTILCIFNGPYNFKNFADWNVDKFVSLRTKFKAKNGGSDDEGSPRKKQKVKDDGGFDGEGDIEGIPNESKKKKRGLEI